MLLFGSTSLFILVSLTACNNSTHIREYFCSYLQDTIQTSISTYASERSSYPEVNILEDEQKELERKLSQLDKDVLYIFQFVEEGNCAYLLRPDKYYHASLKNFGILLQWCPQNAWYTSKLLRLGEEAKTVDFRLYSILRTKHRISTISREIAELNNIAGMLTTYSKDWEIVKIQDDIYFISGYALGWMENAFTRGEWYVYVRENRVEPNEAYSSSLYRKISHRCHRTFSARVTHV